MRMVVPTLMSFFRFLYEIAAFSDVPKISLVVSTNCVTEALAAAARLALALIEGTGASPVYLSGLERTETGYTVSFRYQAGGVPVLFPDEGDALTVTITGAAVTAFSYRCRSYTPQEEAAPLLPSGMAQALGSLYPGTELSVGYVDEGAGALKACWLAG